MAQDVIEAAPPVVHVADVDVPQLDVGEAQRLDDALPRCERAPAEVTSDETSLGCANANGIRLAALPHPSSSTRACAEGAAVKPNSLAITSIRRQSAPGTLVL